MNNQEAIKNAKENIYKQACMAGLAVLVTIVLIFAMSVAWYSNVIHTEGLVFETASWDFNFEGSVTVGDEEAEAWAVAPGDSGIVSLQVVNEGADAITVLVNVMKSTMTTLMQERIYFYVDSNETINGEVVERVYINASDEYAYRLLAGETLVLNETYHSHPYLKWEWVYDVLGYYVTGTMSEEGVMSIEDYMRPVVYDYDSAVFDEEGNLLAVEGGITREEFLRDLLATDGYQGGYPEDSEKLEMINGYYPVVVDEDSGYGIWLYLATEQDIISDTKWDAEISKMEDKSFTARLMLSGQKENTVVTEAVTAAELEEALNGGSDKVVITGDLSISDGLTIDSATHTTLDLGGNTLVLENSDTLIQLAEGSSLIVQNGSVVGSGAESAFETVGASLTLNEVEVLDTKIAIQIRDNKGEGSDSYIKISNCNIAAEQAGIMVRGNGEISTRKTYVLVENSDVTGGWYGMLGNGSVPGTEFEIIGSNLKGGWSGIYLPQKDSITTISDSTIEGENGISMKGGTLNILDGTKVLGTGEKEEPEFQNSGCASTGDAIYIETNYENEIKLFVEGDSTFVLSSNSYAIQVYEPDATHVTVEVSGGTFSSNVSAFLKEGYECVELADKTFTVGQQAATFSEEE